MWRRSRSIAVDKRKLLRISRFLGDDAVEGLWDRFVVVVGVGAVGSYCLEALARSGIGRFRLVDFDTVEYSNINRQLVALESTIGRRKVDVACERVHDIEHETKVEVLPIYVDEQSIESVFAPFDGKAPDLIVDAIDSVPSKCLLLSQAYHRGIPVVSSMGAALRKDPTLVRTGDLMDTWGCPLAKQVRTALRKQDVGKGIDVVFSPEVVEFTYGQDGRKKVLGSLPTLTGIFGLNLAHLALNRLLPTPMKGTASGKPRAK